MYKRINDGSFENNMYCPKQIIWGDIRLSYLDQP